VCLYYACIFHTPQSVLIQGEISAGIKLFSCAWFHAPDQMNWPVTMKQGDSHHLQDGPPDIAHRAAASSNPLVNGNLRSSSACWADLHASRCSWPALNIDARGAGNRLPDEKRSGHGIHPENEFVRGPQTRMFPLHQMSPAPKSHWTLRERPGLAQG
jgi:hypothetical protein